MPALDAGRGIFRAKSPLSTAPSESVGRVRSPSPPKVRSPVKVPERFKSPEPPVKSPEPPRSAMSPEPIVKSCHEQNGTVGKNMTNGTATGGGKAVSAGGMENADDQGLTRKKVVKVVRRVVRKVLPLDEAETKASNQQSDRIPEAPRLEVEPVKAKPNAMSGFMFKHDAIKTEDRDDISQGLTSLMVRGRTREPRPRLPRKDERLESERVGEKKEGKPEGEEKKQEVQDSPNPILSTTSPAPNAQQVKSTVNRNSTATPERSTPAVSKPAHSRPMSLPAVVGFIPAPKPTPLSPPPGFVPAPKLASAKRQAPVSTPSPTLASQKPSPMSTSSRSIPASKPPLTTTPVRPEPVSPKPGPQSPSPGPIAPDQPSVSQPEV